MLPLSGLLQRLVVNDELACKQIIEVSDEWKKGLLHNVKAGALYVYVYVQYMYIYSNSNNSNSLYSHHLTSVLTPPDTPILSTHIT